MRGESGSGAADAPGKLPIYRHMLRGSSWAVAATWCMRGIGLLNTAILARLLAPDDFGLVAMASLAIGLLDTLVNFGTGLLLIRQHEASREQCDTAWTIAVIRGLVIAVVLVAAAPAIAGYFSEPRVIPIVYIVAFNAAVGGANNIGLILMRRELDFARDFRYMVTGRLFTLVVTIALAFWLRNYWALALGMVAATLFQCWLSYRMHPYRPRWSLARAREYVNWSVTVVPLNVFYFLASRIDSFIVGRIAPAPVLGLYNVAADVSTMLTSDLTSQVGRALYPSYAKLTEDPARLRRAFLDSLSVLVIVNVAFGLGLCAVSEDFVAVVLGPRWMEAVPLISWLAVAGMLRGITQSLTGQILLVAGKERMAAGLMFVRFVILLVFSMVGAHLGGFEGVAVAITLGTAVIIPIGAGSLVRLLGIRVGELLRACWRPVLAGTAMLAVVRLAHASSIDAHVVTLALDVATGAAVFCATLFALWALSGRPEGAEKMVLAALASRLGRKNALPPA